MKAVYKTQMKKINVIIKKGYTFNITEPAMIVSLALKCRLEVKFLDRFLEMLLKRCSHSKSESKIEEFLVNPKDLLNFFIIIFHLPLITRFLSR